MKSLSKRIKILENITQNKFFLPVLIVDREEDIQLYKNKIGPKTVVILDDVQE